MVNTSSDWLLVLTFLEWQ